jgi:APA family basic amino acid/polyamine antiporter
MTRRMSLAMLQREADDTTHPGGLRRSLTALQLMVLGVGAIIGAGIFVATGTVAATNAGPAIILSFLIAAAGCLCAALCYAEFAAMVPVSGSAYSYAFVTLGEPVAWIIGWCLLLEYLMAAAMVAVGWSGYLAALLGHLGLAMPAALTQPPVGFGAGGLAWTGALVNLPAVAVLLALTGVLLAGLKASMRATMMLVGAKLVVIALFIGVGAFHMKLANWTPFLPENTGEFGHFGWSGVLRGAGVIFFAYLGFDAVSTAAREARRPQVDVPVGIVGSLVVCTLIYIVFALVLVGLAPYRLLAVPNPISVAIDQAGPALAFLGPVVEVGALMGLTSVMLVLLFGQSRILYAMGRDRLVPAAFGQVSPDTRVPAAGLAVTGVLAAVAAGLLPIGVLNEMVSIGTLFAFIVVCAGVLVLRRAEPDRPRPFRTPAAGLVAPLGIAVCGYMMVSLPGETWLRFLVWMALGLAFYGLYGRSHSVLADAA